MKDLNRAARTLNTILSILFWLLIAQGIFTVGCHALMLYRIITDPASISGMMDRLTIDWLTLDAANGFGITLDGAVPMKLIQLVSAVVITVIACRCVRTLKRILLPVEVGQPFRSGISGEIRKLSRHCFYLGWMENLSMLVSVIVIENHYALQELLVTGPITGVAIRPQFQPVWFIVTAVLVILAMVFRRGEELQTLSDETL